MKSVLPDSNLHETLKTNLHTYQAILSKNIRLAKTSYYANQLETYRNDIKNTWKTINGIIHKRKINKAFPEFFISNNEKIRDTQTIADNFNSYFANIGSCLSSSINYDGQKTINNFLKNNILSRFTFNSVTVDDVLKIIRKLATKSSCGHDEISTKLLKLIVPSVAVPLTLIINQSLNTGIFPDRLKIAKVIPLFKKGDNHIFDNYRPISLLPSISKVFEKIASIQLYKYFVDNNLLYKSQYGFRKHHSKE